MNRIYAVGNTHFDPSWLWTWDEAMASIRATFRAALDRMDEDPDFVYSFSTPAVFEWIEQTDPELFARIKSRVREGRWDVAAEGWWLQPDCNAPSGESLIRQGLYGQRYLAEQFGVRGRAVFNIDSFGHSAMLPQILRKSGLDFYAFSRPAPAELELEDDLFRWVAPDGSAVTACRCDGIYPTDTAEALAKAQKDLDGAPHDALLIYGVTDHGGAPTKRAIADVRAAGAKFAPLTDFFEAQKGRVKSERTGELMTRFYGPFSDRREVKRNNRRAEYALDRAEKASFLAERLTGRAYPAEALRRAWKDLLFNQFHDILGGACIPDVFDDARNLHGRALQTANEITHFALQSLCRRVQTLGDNRESVWNLCLFNLNGSDFHGYVEAEVQWAWEFPWYRGGIELIDEAGNARPAQIVPEKSKIPGFRSRFVFEADVPALGWRTYAVRKTGIAPDGDIPESDLQSPFAFRAVEDEGDVWCFNTSDGYGKEIEPPELLARRTVENGPLRVRVKQTWRLRASRLEEDFARYPDGRIEYRFRVVWNERHLALKLYAQAGEDVLAAIPAGSLRRPCDGREYPVGEWLETGGRTLLLDGVSAYDTLGGDVRLTILRSPIYGDLRMGDLDEKMDYEYMEQGAHEGRIVSLPRSLAPSEAQRQAMAFLNPPVLVCEANHPGTLPPTHAGLACAGADGAVVTALKAAEDGEGYVLRTIEYDGNGGSLTLSAEGLPEARAETCPYEIKTLCLRPDGGVSEANLLEENITLTPR